MSVFQPQGDTHVSYIFCKYKWHSRSENYSIFVFLREHVQYTNKTSYCFVLHQSSVEIELKFK